MAQQADQPRVRPIFLIAGGVVLVVVLLLVVTQVFLASDEPLPPLPTTPPPGAGLVPPPQAIPEPELEDLEVFEIFEGRDPFRPLVFPSEDGDGGDGVTQPPPPPPPNGATPEPTAQPPRSGVQVEVLSVAEDESSATVRVGSQVHEGAGEGQTLSSGVVVVAIEGDCVTFRRDSNRFTLCEGESVRK